MNSLRCYLAAVLGGTILVFWVIALGLMLLYHHHRQSSMWDGKMQDLATKILLSFPQDTTLGSGPRLQVPGSTPIKSSNMTFQVWKDQRQSLIQAPDAPATPLQPNFREGASDNVVDGQMWRVFSVADRTGRVNVQVAYLQAALSAEVHAIVLGAVAVVTVLMILAGVLMALAMRYALRPLSEFAASIRQRKKFDLTPLQSAALPTDLSPLVDAFNHLMLHLDQSIESERQFIADAAHELRTPMAAMQAQAQVALRASAPAAKDAALVKLLAVSERSVRLSEQLLDLARLDAGAHTPHTVLADLSELVVHVAREFDVGALQRGRAIMIDAMPCEIECDINEIGILLRNLVDNALRYTHEGGRVRISCRHRGPANNQVVLEVADNGPGVPLTERSAIFKRFHRVPVSGQESGRSSSSGIGLSLVDGIAKLHGASIETGTGLGGAGFSVSVIFAAPQRADLTASHSSAASRFGIQQVQANTG